jgi:hypothetical protein
MTRPCIRGSSKANPSYSACSRVHASSRLAGSPTESPIPCAEAGLTSPSPTNVADILLRFALGIIVFPTDRLDTSDPAAVREYAARYLVPIIGKAGH